MIQNFCLYKAKMRETEMVSREKKMGEEVKVLRFFASPFSSRVELALMLKGVAFEKVEEKLSSKSPLLLESNPVHKKVPVLLHKGRPIAESLVILEYVEETWKENPILPEDPYERAMARFWARFIDDKCMMTPWMAFWTRGEEQKNFLEQAKENLKILEKELKGKRFFGGDSIGLVDIVASFIAHWIPVLEEVTGISLVDEDNLPTLCEWKERLLKSDVVMECLLPREMVLDFLQSRKEKFIVNPTAGS